MKKPYVYVTRKVPEETLAELREVAEIGMWPEEEEPVPRDVLLKEAERADGLVTMLTEQVDRELFECAASLKVVANVAVGHDNIDVEAATEHGVTVTNTPDVLTDTTADLVFALLMGAARRIMEAAEYVKKDRWTVWSPMQMAGLDVHHKTLGIVGMGRIGEAVAKRAKGFDMEILYHNRTRKPEAEGRLGAVYSGFDELLAKADFVVCLTPMTEQTRRMFNAKAFRKMKNSAVFVNAARGGVVDESDLEAALKGGEIAAAGLDVFQNEPISSDHPLVQLENVVALPHIGSASQETRTVMIELACRNAALILKGQRAQTPVN
ncbi:MAG TPA: D-glycerate dehydrogenase [Bacillales bacterium]|nr:D-glycerate dehydrogenase [Bacillales bacterium]